MDCNKESPNYAALMCSTRCLTVLTSVCTLALRPSTSRSTEAVASCFWPPYMSIAGSNSSDESENAGEIGEADVRPSTRGEITVQTAWSSWPRRWLDRLAVIIIWGTDDAT